MLISFPETATGELARLPSEETIDTDAVPSGRPDTSKELVPSLYSSLILLSYALISILCSDDAEDCASPVIRLSSLAVIYAS